MKKLQLAGFVTLAVLAASGGAFAQDSYYGPSSFEGFYVGGYAGGMLSPTSKWTGGGIVGANFEVTESMYVGAEVQGGFSTDGTATEFDALMLGKFGALVSPETMAYVAGGGGVVDGKGSFAAGGGVEYMPVDAFGVRGEVLGIGNTVDGYTDTKVTAGVIWHVK